MRKDADTDRSSHNPPWGVLSCIDLYDCDAKTIRNAEKIRQFVMELCHLIEMKRFGETQVVNFGEEERVAGYSMTQLIETSLISAHFANLTNTTYLAGVANAVHFQCNDRRPRKGAKDAKIFNYGPGSMQEIVE